MVFSRVIVRSSHIGRASLNCPPGIEVNFSPNRHTKSASQHASAFHIRDLLVKGPLGTLSVPVAKGLCVFCQPGEIPGEKKIGIRLDDQLFEKSNKKERKFIRSMWGTAASLLRTSVEGVSEGHQVSLKLVGIGYKASCVENFLHLKLGYTHEQKIRIPNGIQVSVVNGTKVILKGIDYPQITSLAAKIRELRKPEPYNGKGIFVGNEKIKLKEGKKK